MPKGVYRRIKPQIQSPRQLANLIHQKEGIKNIKWKGNDVGYRALHNWVENRLGKPMRCSHCGCDELKPRGYHWANKSHEYLRDLSDWIRLCVKCHIKYDKQNKHA